MQRAGAVGQAVEHLPSKQAEANRERERERERKRERDACTK
jgi:hypothetical protein